MVFERNRQDPATVSVEELGLIDGGQSDEAIASITGSYPQEDNIYLRNKVSDMHIIPLSGLGEIIIRTSKKRLRYTLDPQNQKAITVAANEGYCYTPAIGETLVVRLISTPPWHETQYDTIEYDDVK